jgi:hypothetical protein
MEAGTKDSNFPFAQIPLIFSTLRSKATTNQQRRNIITPQNSFFSRSSSESRQQRLTLFDTTNILALQPDRYIISNQVPLHVDLHFASSKKKE